MRIGIGSDYWRKLENGDDPIADELADLQQRIETVEQEIEQLNDRDVAYASDFEDSAEGTALEKLFASGKSTLIIDRGEYELINPLFVPSNTRIIGYGATLKIKNSELNYAAALIGEYSATSASYNDNCHHVTIEGLNITCDNGTGIAMGIGMIHAYDITIRNCQFSGWSGSHMVELNASYECNVTDCIFNGYNYISDAASSEALQIDIAYPGSFPAFAGFYPVFDGNASRDIRIYRNYFNGQGAAPTEIRRAPSAIGTHAVDQGDITFIEISDNFFVRWHTCIWLRNGGRIQVLNNHAFDCVGFFHALGASDAQVFGSITITGNIISGILTLPAPAVAGQDYLADGIYIQRARFATISNNTIFNYWYNGVHIAGDFCTVNGNNVSYCRGSGIRIYNLISSTVSGNTCYGNNSGAGAVTNASDISVQDGNTSADIGSTSTRCLVASNNVSNMYVETSLYNAIIGNFVALAVTDARPTGSKTAMANNYIGDQIVGD